MVPDRVKVVPSAPNSRSVARRSAFGSFRLNQCTRARDIAAIDAVREQSALRTQKPPSGKAAGSAPFSVATPSSSPSPSRWLAPTLVTMAPVGRASRAR